MSRGRTIAWVGRGSSREAVLFVQEGGGGEEMGGTMWERREAGWRTMDPVCVCGKGMNPPSPGGDAALSPPSRG